MTPGIEMALTRSYVVQSAHRLPHVPPGHKCGRLHGHTYGIDVEISGRVDPSLGWVLDFAFLDAAVAALIVDQFDHHDLNAIAGLENPTSEVLAWWCWQRLAIYAWPTGVRVTCVSISENNKSRVTLREDSRDRDSRTYETPVAEAVARGRVSLPVVP